MPISTVSALKPLQKKTRKKGEFRCWRFPKRQRENLHCWDGVDDLVELEAIKYRGLAGGIKTKHKDAGVLGEVAVDELGKEVTHGGCFGCR